MPAQDELEQDVGGGAMAGTGHAEEMPAAAASAADAAAATPAAAVVAETADTAGAKAAPVAASAVDQYADTPREEQATVIHKLIVDNPLVEGTKWALVSPLWWGRWKTYVGYSDRRGFSSFGMDEAPGPIDNSPLFGLSGETEPRMSADQKLKQHLVDNYSYVTLPAAAMELLVMWYSMAEGQTPIWRSAVKHNGRAYIEVYPHILMLARFPNYNSLHIREFSKANTIADVKAELCRLYELPDDKTTRVRGFHLHTLWDPLDESQTISELRLTDKQTVVVEAQRNDGTWESERAATTATAASSSSAAAATATTTTTNNRVASSTPSYSSSSSAAAASPSSASASSSTYLNNKFTSAGTYGGTGRTTGYGTGYGSGYNSSSGYSSSSYGSSSYGSGYRGTSSYFSDNVRPGTTGLNNIGNTCFMNSGIQCLSHTAPLVDFFLSGRFKADINRDNPIGQQGRLAEEFARLLGELWGGTRRSVTPSDLKHLVTKVAPQFGGYQQHDSQELLAFLLDGLHEDLNRILKKPYVEAPEGGVDQDDVEVGRASWEIHKQRNDSMIVDLFHGQFKSTLVCPHCEKVSITFDPMMYLTLPIPDNELRAIDRIYFVGKDPSQPPLRLNIKVPKTSGTMGDVKASIAKMTGAVVDDLFLFEEYNHRFYLTYTDYEKASSIGSGDVVMAYELPPPPNSERDADLVIPVLMREKVKSTYGYSSTMRTTGKPVPIRVPPKATYDDLARAIRRQLRRYVKFPGADSDSDDGGAAAKTAAAKAADDDSGSDAELDDMLNDIVKSNPVLADSDDEGAAGSSSSSKANGGAGAASLSLEPFVLRFTNSWGADNGPEIKPGAVDIEFPAPKQCVLALDADTADVCSVLDDEEAKRFTEHESMKTKFDEQQSTDVTLAECLQLFEERETLGKDNMWYCSTCKEHVRASKQLQIWTLPEVLIVHLKRFSQGKWNVNKLTAMVDFPLEGLDLKEFVHGPVGDASTTYDLFGVSNHMGGLGGGHYTAHCKLADGGQWYHFDDAHVSPAHPSDAKSKASYVLFYGRRGSAAAKAAVSAVGAGSIDGSVG